MLRIGAVLTAFLCILVWLIASCRQNSFSSEALGSGAGSQAQASGAISVADQEIASSASSHPSSSASLPSLAHNRCAPDDPAEVTEILIGALNTDVPRAGLAIQVAFRLAESDLNASGGVLGKPLRLVLHNTDGSPEGGADLSERLMTADCVVGLVGVFHSSVAMAVKETAHLFKTPMIFADTYMDEITIDHYPEIFRIAPSFSMLAQMEAEWLQAVGDHNGDGQKTAVLIVENNASGHALAQATDQWLAQYGIDHYTLSVDLPTDDFTSEIARVVALNHLPDVVFIKFNGDASYLLLRQLIDAGIGPHKNTILVTRQSALNHDAFWKHAPGGTFTVINRVGPWYPTVRSEIGQNFVTHYRKMLNRWPESYAFEAYDSVRLLAAAIEEADSLSAEKIIQALESIHIELASGVYSFPYNSQNPPDNEAIPDYMWHQWPDVPFLFLQYTEPEQDSANVAVVWPNTYSTVEGPVLP